MRRVAIVALCALALAPAVEAAPRPTGGTTLQIPQNQAVRLTLSQPAKSMVVANPEIADINVSDADSLIVIGKRVGATSLFVVDRNGRTILQRTVVVTRPADPSPQMTYFRGAKPQTFRCAPDCTPQKAEQDSPFSGLSSFFSGFSNDE